MVLKKIILAASGKSQMKNLYFIIPPEFENEMYLLIEINVLYI